MKHLNHFFITIFILLGMTVLLFADEVKIIGPTSGVNFGQSIAVDDSFMIVGAPRDDEQNTDAGAFFIYKKGGSGWQSMGKFMDSEAGYNHFLGNSVAISGNYAIAGAPDDDNGDAANYNESGSIFLYKYDNNQWTKESKFVADDKQKIARYGYEVAMNENFAFVGAHGKHEANTHSGAVYVYQKSLWGWSFLEKLTESDLGVSDFFGRAIDVDGDILVIGAHQHDPGSGNRTGAVYIYQFNGSSWQFKQKITASDGEDMDGFGRRVAISGDYIIVGAPFDDDKGDEAGIAYIFNKEGSSWTQIKKLVAINGLAGDRFGWDVAIHNDMALVGAYMKSNPETNNGSVYAYRLNEGNWLQTDIHIPSDETSWSQFGFWIELTDSSAYISAHPQSALYIYNPFTDLNMAKPEVDIPDFVINVGESFTPFLLDDYVVDLSDPDEDLTWSFSGATDMEVAIEDRVVTVTPQPAPWYGSETIEFKAKDPVWLTGKKDVVFTVNAGPVISDLPAALGFPANQSDTLNVWQYVEDLDNADDELTYTFNVDNDSLLYTFNEATGELYLTANPAYTGTCTLTITATDYNDASATDDISVTVDPPVGIFDNITGMPGSFALLQNYPNPFNPVTKISYRLSVSGDVELAVYNILGEKMAALVNKYQASGTYTIEFNGAFLPSGVYFYKISAGEYTAGRKMILMK